MACEHWPSETVVSRSCTRPRLPCHAQVNTAVVLLTPHVFSLSELLAAGSVNVYVTNVGLVGASTVTVNLPDPAVRHRPARTTPTPTDQRQPRASACYRCICRDAHRPCAVSTGCLCRSAAVAA